MPRGRKTTKPISKLKEIDLKIKALEKELAELKEQRKLLVISEKSDKLMAIDDLLSESGMTIAQFKSLIRSNKKTEPKKPRGRKKKEETTITEEIDKE